MNTRWTILITTTLLAIGGCTTLPADYEPPSVTVTYVRAMPAERAGLPDFEIGLRVLNPNANPLELRGVSFSVSLDGHSLVKGVGNQLPVIEGYGSGDFAVTAAPNILAGIRFMSSFINEPKDSFRYELKAKLDVGAFRRAIRIRDAGEISLQPEA